MSVQLQAGGSLRIPMSYEEYQALGETKHHEYYDGLTVVNPPTRRHIRVARRLTRLLDDQVPRGTEVLPEGGWQPADETVFVPDLMVVDIDAPGPDLLLAAPLLIVEILSPSTRGDDRGRKMRAYADGGAPWYWIADPDAETLTVHRNTEGTFAVVAVGTTSQPLDLVEPFAISLDLAALFA